MDHPGRPRGIGPTIFTLICMVTLVMMLINVYLHVYHRGWMEGFNACDKIWKDPKK